MAPFLTSGFSGRGLISYYDNSVSLSTIHAYPERAWQVWKFERTPKGWWETFARQCEAGNPMAHAAFREYIEGLSLKYKIKHWGSITNWDALALNKTDLYRLGHFKSLKTLILSLFPNQNADYMAKPKVEGASYCLT